jgi:hypothetical protein
VFPIIFLLNLDPAVNQLIASLSFAFADIAAMAILFVPKVFTLLDGADLDGLDIKKKSPKIAIDDVQDNARVEKKRSFKGNPGQVASGDLLFAESILHKVKDLDERAFICRQQIDQWRAKLVQVEERISSTGSTGSGLRASDAARQTSLVQSVAKEQRESKLESMAEDHVVSFHGGVDVEDLDDGDLAQKL